MAPPGSWLEGIMAVCLIMSGRVAEVAERPDLAADSMREAVRMLRTVCAGYPAYGNDLAEAIEHLQRLKWVNRGLRGRRREIGEVNYMHML